jgi:hypothetical protein
MKIKHKFMIIIMWFVVPLAFQNIAIAAIDAPHNESNSVNCGSCHGEGLLQSFWGGSGIYSTFDELCLSCHTASSGPYTETNAPLVKTHSSDNLSNQYGEWSRECRDCHDPHYQKQKVYKNTDAVSLYLATGTINGCVYNGNGTSTLTYVSITYKTGWDATRLLEKTDEYRRAILFPNVGKLGYSYPVTGINEVDQEITVTGDATPVYQYISSSTFAMMYGQYLKDIIEGSLVKFLDQTGDNSYADGDTTYDGVCEVCHTQTKYHLDDGTGSAHYASNNCRTCHSHIDGFGHRGGGAGGECIECHGHDAGYEYSPGQYSQGKGTYTSHSTHTENDSDDLKGPFIACDACHNTSHYPRFIDANFLSATNVCDTCHSPSGSFDGVDSTGNSIGAKDYWTDAIYPDLTSQEKWCAGCHDDVPAVVDGNTAPDIVGDNTTYGYYLNIHGAGTDGVKRTAVSYSQGECLHCHDVTLARTSHEVPLFYTLFVDQNTGFCFNCHTAPSESLQTSMPNQYSYSYMHGGSDVTCPDNIRLAFSGDGYIHIFSDPTDLTLSGCTISLVSSEYVLLCAANPPDKYADNSNAKLQTSADFVLKVKTHDNNIAQTEGPEIRVFLQGDSNPIGFDIYSSSIRIRYGGTDRATTALTRQADTYLRVSRVGTTYYFQASSDSVYKTQITDEISWDYGTSRDVDKIRLLTSGCTDSIYYDDFLFFYFDPGPPCDPNQGWFSSHYLYDVRESLKGKWGWGDVVENIDPCSGCHNPHRTIRDYPASLADGHVDPSTWDVWGDESGEKMADYISGLGIIYQPPYSAGGGYERDADTQPDYNTLCLKCHSTSHTSTRHGSVNTVDWSTSRHGKAAADNIPPASDFGNLKPPYDEANRGKYVLCCTDCHEPHGSTNSFLLRKTVNGVSALPAGDGTSLAGGYWYYWCSACHDLTEHVMAFPQYRCADNVGCHVNSKNHSYWF